MEQLPKIVGQRLQAVSGAHPDANLLAAFAEKSLLSREQTQVLDHLAACAVCREVVAHAQPEEVLERVAVAAAPGRANRRPWFQGAVVRWAALAACVVVVGTVVISRSHFSSKPSAIVAMNKQAPTDVKAEVQPTLSAPAAEQGPTRQYESKSVRLKGKLDDETRRDTDKNFELDKLQSAKTLPSAREEREQLGENAGDLATKQKVSATTQSVEVTSEAVRVDAPGTEDAKATKKEFSADKVRNLPVTGRNEVALAQTAAAAPPPPSPAAKPAPESPVVANGRARSETAEVRGFYKPKDGYADTGTSAGAAVGGLSSALRYPTPRWQLSAEGKLIKSSDLGRSWQPVPIGDKTTFRALCVTDREVWVGGASGTLFYSATAGESWEQVKPSAKGKDLTADITAIAFTDPQHGKVTTVRHETWITSDGGHAWQVETR